MVIGCTRLCGGIDAKSPPQKHKYSTPKIRSSYFKGAGTISTMPASITSDTFLKCSIPIISVGFSVKSFVALGASCCASALSGLGWAVSALPAHQVIASSGECGFMIFWVDYRARLINTSMSNREFLQSIYDTVRSMGLVQSQYEFGKLCGRKQSWLSCAKSMDRQMSIGALVTLAVNLERIPIETLPRKLRPMRKQLVSAIWSIIETQGSQRAAVSDLSGGR